MNKTFVNKSLFFVSLLLLAVPNTAMAVMTFELQSAGTTNIADYSRSYDIMATRTGTDGLKIAEMIVSTSEAGSIYQNSLIADNPGEAYDTFVTIGTVGSPLGPNPADTHIDGGAVDLGGAVGATFTNQNIDLSWSAETGTSTGAGTTRIGRLTLADWASGSYSITGFEGLGIQGDTLEGTFVPIQMSLSISQVAGSPSAPAGYTSYDFYASVNTNMGVMELMLDTDNPGDIYQNSLTPDDAAEDYDTYVTVGYPAGGEQPANTRVHGGAVDLGGAAAATFTNQNIDIAWSPEEAVQTGHGMFQIARVTLKNGTTNNSWTFKGWQGGFEDAFTLSGNISLMAGDVNGDDFVGGGDLNTILGNWGASGARRNQGDLTGEGDVGGADYNQVLGHWGEGTPPEPGAIPEPATIAVLAMGGLVVLMRSRRG